jgi:hypothetical protein
LEGIEGGGIEFALVRGEFCAALSLEAGYDEVELLSGCSVFLVEGRRGGVYRVDNRV